MSRGRTENLRKEELKESAGGKGRGKFTQVGMGCMVLVLGCLFFLYGIHRQEHLTVEKKSNMICLECIGIG